ncbi:MAG: 3-oxoacyl-ACP reductase FabG [Betaproteobacteria bacterium]|nr:3-oxoacyl-ACP reductase FabG [Betaproteobacteria bacterium]
MKVAERVAVVTGSGSGIGKEIMNRLTAHGARGVVVDINREAADKTVAEIKARGGDAVAVTCDCTSKSDVQAMVEQALAHYGRIDILVNNVGIVRDNYLTKMPEADWDLVLNVNLKTYFLCSQAVVPKMMDRQYGRIINISSRAWLGNAGQANYSAAKGGIVSLTRTLALELGKFNITSNCIAPGVIDTPLIRSLRPDVQERLAKMQPTPRFGTPAEVAYAAHFFASDEAWYMTGQVLYVCGGKSLGIYGH